MTIKKRIDIGASLWAIIGTNDLRYACSQYVFKMTGIRRTVNVINHGNYDKRTELNPGMNESFAVPVRCDLVELAGKN